MKMLRSVMLLLAVGSLGLAGCSQSEPASPAEATSNHAGTGHSHDGWWCDEHGVPEEVCTLCDANLVAGFKAKGDWCKQHERPDSQCFVCHPERESEFAAQYEAKYGKQPPKPRGADGRDSPHENDSHS